MTNSIWHWSARTLALRIKNKEISCVEVVEAHLARIDAINDRINAVTEMLSEQALKSAKRVDTDIASGRATGPLLGVPFTVKDVLDVDGSATTFGVVALRHTIPDCDAPVIANLRRAGAIPIARTNVPDFGFRYHTDNDLWGATVNPWNPSRTPGGSSGGEAAAIATGMSPLGIGGDMGGSLRYPAQCCGIAAIRPSLGRVSRTTTSIFDSEPKFYEQFACVNGPMARSVGDLRLALDVMSQDDHQDPLWSPAYTDPPVTQRPIHIALVSELPGIRGPTSIKETIEIAAATLTQAGYRVEEAVPPSLDETTQVIQRIADAEMMSYLPDMLPMMSTDGVTFAQLLVGTHRSDLDSYMGALADRHRIARQWRDFMRQYPLILGPVSALEPFEVGYDIAGTEQVERFVRSITLTEACNLIGLPGVSVPVRVVDGLPHAVQLIAPRFREDLCLDAAEVVERSHGTLTPIDPLA